MMALTDVSAECYARSWRPGLFRRLWMRLCAWQAQRLTLRLLHSLDSATLRDLGITPHEIESLVYSVTEDRLRHYDANWWRR
ncbi:MAG TPA: DUF1127 domain-containing protein [Xanthobacteraceae bacterium]|nr:DUF1127 domain-containing protein [Xanthobacteraceae bacterium]